MRRRDYYFWLNFSFSLNLEEGGNAKITKTQKFKFIYSDDDKQIYSSIILTNEEALNKNQQAQVQ